MMSIAHVVQNQARDQEHRCHPRCVVFKAQLCFMFFMKDYVCGWSLVLILSHPGSARGRFGLNLYLLGLNRPVECGCRWVGAADRYHIALAPESSKRFIRQSTNAQRRAKPLFFRARWTCRFTVLTGHFAILRQVIEGWKHTPRASALSASFNNTNLLIGEPVFNGMKERIRETATWITPLLIGIGLGLAIALIHYP